MFKIPLSEIKDKIKQEKKLTEEEINERIKNKINELSGLISEEGAAHIIANELGIKIVEEEGRLKVKSIYSGMKNIEFLGKVVDKSEIREFNKGERSGKVGSFTIGDETGTIRAVCWNDQTDLLNKINKDDLVLIKSGYVKENNYNQKELHLNDRSKIEINPEGETIGEVKIGLTYERKKISDLKEEDNQIEILGTIVQVMDPRFFQVCPECNKRLTEKDDGFYCNDHEKVEPADSYVVNLVLDDGSGTIRSVFWKNQTNNLLGKNEEEILAFKGDLGSFEDTKTELLGEQFRVIGRVNRNDMFDRLEFSAQIVEKGNPDDEIKRLEEN